MGGGKGGSSTQTVSIPPEVLARYNAVNARAENVATTPFSPYSTSPEGFVSPLSTSQQAGIANINALQGSANQAVGAGQSLQGQGVDTARQAQGQAQGVNMAALQGISQAQQQGTAYNQAAGQNIGNAMGAAAPFMQGNAALQQQGLAQQQGYQRAATQNAANIAASAEPYLAGNAALQQQGLAQQQGYQQAATQNIGNAMGSASPYMQQMAGLTQAGLGAGQQYLSGATGLTQQALQTGQQMAGQAQPYYTGALQAAQPLNQGSAQLTQAALQSAQPLNQQAQQYMGAGAQAVGPEALNYGQYMNPFLSNVVGAQQALQAQENAAQRSAMKGKAIQSGAFGGDRAGIEQANLARQQSLANQATLSNLLQSGFNQAQQQAAQQQGVSLGAAQANRAAQQQAAQQAAALGQQNFAQNLGAAQQIGNLGQQNYAQTLGVGQGLSALGQQQYAQQLGAGAQVGQLGQQGYQQALGAGAQLGQVGQNLYNQNIGQGQALANLGQQGLQAMQGTGTNLGAIGMNRAALQGQQGQALANLGQQGLAAMQGTGTNLGNIGQQLFGQNVTQGQAIQGLGQQQFALGLAGAQGAAAIGQNMYGQGAQTAGLEQAGGMNMANLGLQNQGAQIAGAQAQMAAGQQQQQTEQAAKTALYNQFLQQQGYPFQIAQFLGNLAMGTGSLSGSTTTATRTGYRGGRMGDGYASGGLVPPNSQGGVVYAPGLYARGGYAPGGMPDTDPDTGFYWDDEAGKYISPYTDDEGYHERYAPSEYNQYRAWHGFTTPLGQTAASTPTASTPAEVSPQLADAAKTNPALQQNISDYQAVSGVNKDVSSAFKDATGKDIDAASARKYQDMLNAGMSLDQVKYNIGSSQPALLKSGDVGALKGQSLAYNAENFAKPSAPVKNQFGSYAAPAPKQASGKGASQPQPQTQPYYGQPAYNYGGGYSQPTNYGMPNFGNYGGAPNYAGAAYYGGQQQYGYQPQQPQQASGKGASQPQPQPTYQAPQATGKGASQPAQQPPQASGKGMSTGGRTAYASGGRAGYAAGGGDPSSVLRGLISQYDPGDPQGLVARQAAMFAGAPGAAAGYVPPTQSGAGQYKMMTPQSSILPQQQSGLKEAVSMGTSIASLGKTSSDLYEKLKNKFGDEPPKAMSSTTATAAPKVAELTGLSPDLTQTASIPDAAGKGVGTFAANGGRIGYNAGGIPGLDDLKQGKADIPGGEGLETPMSKVVSQGTQTPAELKGQMNSMSSGAGGLGGGSGGGGIGSAIGTAASIVSLGNAAMSAGSWIGANVLPALMAFSDKRMKTDIKPIGKTFDGQTIHRYKYKGDPKTQIGLIAQEVEKAHPKAVGLAGGMKTVNYDTATREAAKRGHFADGGSAMLDLENPQDQAMAEAFDNLLQRYDNNPLLAAAAMDVGTKAVDAAIMKAEQTGGEVTDFLPRRTQEYMFALSKAALGAHDAMSREARKSGGRTGYALPGSVDDEPTGLAPAPSQAMTMGDVAGGLSPEPTVQVAELKNPDILRALRGVEGANNNPEAKNPNSTAGGLYQYVDDTWRKQAPLAGVDIKQYPNARSAPAEVQHQVADANVSRILEQNKGNVQAVPHMWYSGNVEGKLSPEGLAANKGFTQEQYNQRFFNRLGTGEPEQKPVQVAAVTGLAPKTLSDEPKPWETIGKKILPDAVPTDSSFWVPLIAGLGTMLASDKYRFSQRLGEGLVGGAAAYGKQQEFGLQQQKVGSELAKNSLGILNDRFMELPNGMFYDKLYGIRITPQQRASFASSLPGMSAMTGQAAAPSTTKQEAAPRVEAPATAAPSTTEPPASKPRVPDILAPLNEQPAKTTETPKIPTTAAEALDLAENHPKVQEQYATAKKFENQAMEAQKEVDYYTKVKPWLPNAAANATRAQSEQQNAERKASEAKARGEKLRDQFAATDLERLKVETSKKAEEPFAAKGKAREIEFPIQFKARTDAANEAMVGRNLLQQTDAMMNLMFDKEGKPVVNSGPLGAAINKMAAVAKQAGFSDGFINDVLKTDPTNAQSIEKLRTTLSTEIGRQEMNGAPIRVTEFQRFLETTPGETLLPDSFKWIVENILQPKAKSSIGAYEKVKRMDPAEHNIQAELDDYARDNKWYGVSPGQQTESRTTSPASKNETQVRELTPEEKQRLADEIFKRRGKQGAQ